MNLEYKIGLITVYFGPWPPWFNLFLESCKSNVNIDFLIFSDNPVLTQNLPNIKSVFLTLNDFNSRVSEILKLNITISDPYKLCDFKPVFGEVFGDYIKEYNFWGYCDIDIIFGQISKFISNKSFAEYDIISTYSGFLSGPFCLYRNEIKVNRLYKNTPFFKKIFSDEKMLGFDENIPRPSNMGISLRKCLLFVRFLAYVAFTCDIFIKNVSELRYQFQWFTKRKTIKHHSLNDMSEIIWDAENKGLIKYFHQELTISPSHFARNGSKSWVILYNNGKLIDIKKGDELFAFHLRSSKMKNSFSISSKISTSFKITEKGIFTSHEV
jgi:hypothetical protein